MVLSSHYKTAFTAVATQESLWRDVSFWIHTLCVGVGVCSYQNCRTSAYMRQVIAHGATCV